MLLALPASAQRLLRGGRDADDSETIKTADHAPDKPVYVYLLLRISGGAQITVKSATNGRSFAVETRFDETVLSLKGKIEEREGTPISLMKLFFNGTVLEDHRALGDYGVTQGSVVSLTLKMRGT